MVLTMLIAPSFLPYFILFWLLCAIFFYLICSTFVEPEPQSEPSAYTESNKSNETQIISDESSAFLFKIKYKKTLKRLHVFIYDGNLDFNMNELRDKITYIFGLQRYSELEISYIDEDGELITMTDENDLMDIMTQKKLQYRLRMYVKLINNTTTAQLGGAGLKPTPTNLNNSKTSYGYGSLMESNWLTSDDWDTYARI